MYTKNIIGPSTESWGTPLKTDFQLETCQSTTTQFVSRQLAIALSK